MTQTLFEEKIAHETLPMAGYNNRHIHITTEEKEIPDQMQYSYIS